MQYKLLPMFVAKSWRSFFVSPNFEGVFNRRVDGRVEGEVKSKEQSKGVDEGEAIRG